MKRNRGDDDDVIVRSFFIFYTKANIVRKNKTQRDF